MIRALIRRMESQMKALLLDSSWITSHFGINPRKGGNPPSERKEISVIILIPGVLKLCLDSWLK